MGNKTCIDLQFAAQNEDHIGVRKNPARRVDVCDATVQPDSQRWERVVNAVKLIDVRAFAFNSVQIGEVEIREIVKLQEPGGDTQRLGARRKWGRQWPVVGAIAGDGVHRDAVLHVDDGYDLQGCRPLANAGPSCIVKLDQAWGRKGVRTGAFDIGGAHLKIALAEGGRLLCVRQILCPLWLGVDRLEQALVAARSVLGQIDQAVVTMTGELADIFPDRATGVRAIIATLTDKFDAARFWSGLDGFCAEQAAVAEPLRVASMNFLATAQFAAKSVRNGVVIDMGSTTVDIVAICDGAPRPIALTDGERLASGELVYTGLTRTPVMAVVDSVTFAGRRQGVANEYFANMSDVRRVLEDLPEEVRLTCDC